MDQSKEAVAERLAQAHYAIEPGIELILRLESPEKQEKDPAEPVKLLEVNPDTIPSGVIPVHFGPHPASGIFYPSTIVEVTPEEYAQIVRRSLTLPHDWRLGRRFERAITAKAG